MMVIMMRTIGDPGWGTGCICLTCIIKCLTVVVGDPCWGALIMIRIMRLIIMMMWTVGDPSWGALACSTHRVSAEPFITSLLVH